MKRFAALTTFVLIFLTTPALAQAGDQLVRRISVTGTVETQVAPDMVVWRINLSDEHEQLSEAKAASDALAGLSQRP